MASPFRYFRKHAKVFLAVAAVLAIFIFVVGDALVGSQSSGNGRDAGATVATWNGGSINEGQLASLVQQRIIVNDFLLRLFVQGGGQTDYDLPQNIPNLVINPDRLEQVVESAVIQTEVLADLARRAGLTVSDEMVNHYIQEMGLKKLGGDEVAGILRSVGSGHAGANEAIVFNTLRKMLLAHLYQRMYADASQVVLPEQRWDDWRKVNERISLQAAILPAEKFLPEVPEPTEAQLLGFFNDHKNRDPDEAFERFGDRELPLPVPGFAQPRQVRLQYLMGSIPQRAEQLLSTVTEDEIADYYERNKRLEFIKSDLPDDEEPSDSAEPTAPTAAESGDEAPAETSEQPTDQPADEAAPATESTPTESDAPATAEPAASPQPPTDTPADAAPAAEDNESSSSARSKSPFRLVALQAASPQPNDEQPAAAEPAGEVAAATGPDAAKPDAPQEEEIEYEPLEKVREDIRQQLARDKAVQELERVMSEATAELQSEYNRYGSAVYEAREKKTNPPKPPARLTDLTWLAEKHGLTYEKTAPLTFRGLLDTIVGKTMDANTQRRNLTLSAFTSLELFEPFLAKELEGDWYLVMKIEDTPGRVPEFKEVRDEVAKAWKLAEAAKLAEKRAKELSAEAEKASVPFDQFFADKGFGVVKQTEFFSYRSYPVGQGGTGAPPVLSEIPELPQVGPDFMEAAFSLEGNKTIGLLNFDHSAAYVIRLNRRQWTEDELKKLFLEEESSWPGRIDMFLARTGAFSQIVENEILTKRAGLKFDEEWQARRQKRLEEQQN